MSARRLIAALIVWVGLFGAIAPAFACAQAALQGECCPPDAPGGCDPGTAVGDASLTIQVCCASVPASSVSAVAADYKPNLKDETLPPPTLVSAYRELAASPALHSQLLEQSTHVAHDDASTTYLLTGRLRL